MRNPATYSVSSVSVHLTFKQQNSCSYISIIGGWCEQSYHLHQSLSLLSVRQVFFLMSPGYIKHQRINSVFSLSLAVDCSHPYIDISMQSFLFPSPHNLYILYTHTHFQGCTFRTTDSWLTDWHIYCLCVNTKAKILIKRTISGWFNANIFCDFGSWLNIKSKE